MQKITSACLLIAAAVIIILAHHALSVKRPAKSVITQTNYVTITNHMTVDKASIPAPEPVHGSGYFVLRGQNEYYRKDFE